MGTYLACSCSQFGEGDSRTLLFCYFRLAALQCFSCDCHRFPTTQEHSRVQFVENFCSSQKLPTFLSVYFWKLTVIFISLFERTSFFSSYMIQFTFVYTVNFFFFLQDAFFFSREFVSSILAEHYQNELIWIKEIVLF